MIGFAIAIAIVRGGLPRWIRSATLTFSGVASNFAGVPLAFAFLATLGRLGLVTVLLHTWFGINIYALGFNLLSFWGLTLTYLYLPDPADGPHHHAGARRAEAEWREAAATLGATNLQYWRMVALPVLWPSLLGTVVAALRQCLRRHRHRLCADRLLAQHRADPALSRRSAATCCTTRISAMRWPSA